MKGKRSFLSVWSVSLFLVAALVVSMPFSSFAQQKGGAAKTLKIGYVLSLSDWYSVFDTVEDRYINACAKMINDKGGVTVQGQRYNIELVGEDGKSTMDGATAAATKLVYDHKVKFVIGATAFFNAAVAPVFEPNKVLHVLGYYSAQPGELDNTTPFGFLGYNASIGNTLTAVKAMKKEFPNVKKLVIVTPDDGAIPYLMPKVKKILEANGFTPVGDIIGFPNQMEDFSPIAAKADESRRPTAC